MAGSEAGRLAPVDATRAMAILGMLVAHLAGQAADRWGFLHWVNGYAAGGFAVLAGVSMGLTRRMGPTPGWRPWVPQVARSAWLFALGVVLAGISFGPIVILCVYAVLFLVAMPLRRLNGPVLLGLGLAGTVVSPVLSLWLRVRWPGSPLSPGYAVNWTMLRGPAPVTTVARTLILDGAYPLLTWLPLALVGWGAQRVGLLAPPARRQLALAAAILLAAGFGLSAATEAVTHSRAELIAASTTRPGVLVGARGERVGSIDEALGPPNAREAKVLLTAGHHSGTTFELWQILGVTAGFLTGFALLGRLGAVGRRALTVAGWPGRIALTVYTAHLVAGWALDHWNVGLGLEPVPQARVLVAFVAGAFALGAVFRGRRGPLEAVLHQITVRATRTT